MFLELSAQSLGLYTVVNFCERMIPTVKPEQNVGKGGGVKNWILAGSLSQLIHLFWLRVDFFKMSWRKNSPVGLSKKSNVKMSKEYLKLAVMHNVSQYANHP